MPRISIQKTVDLLNSGHVVAVPTETVYGLAASLKHPEAIKKIFSIKGRPNNKPLSVLVASIDQARSFAQTISATFNQLAKKYWPGPLTIVVPANLERVPEEIRVGQNTVGLRVPDNVDLLDILDKVGPLAAPSANLSGQEPARSADEVLKIFGNDFPVLDGGACQGGVESTVVSLEEDQIKVLREGAIKKEVLLCPKGSVFSFGSGITMMV